MVGVVCSREQRITMSVQTCEWNNSLVRPENMGGVCCECTSNLQREVLCVWSQILRCVVAEWGRIDSSRADRSRPAKDSMCRETVVIRVARDGRQIEKVLSKRMLYPYGGGNYVPVSQTSLQQAEFGPCSDDYPSNFAVGEQRVVMVRNRLADIHTVRGC